MTDEKIYSLCEAVADIAYRAGDRGYYSGNSRQDISDFISWAREFEEVHKDTKWGMDDNMDYIDAIDEFSDKKLSDNRVSMDFDAFGNPADNRKNKGSQRSPFGIGS